jgi:hypothetical protein
MVLVGVIEVSRRRGEEVVELSWVNRPTKKAADPVTGAAA